ncbi:MAG: hypothetical protein JW818_22970 [Pirellulales bacterium]|nr:hypothetical protein [Pirellulales bacterium]
MNRKRFLVTTGCLIAIGLLAAGTANAETMYPLAESGFNTSASGIQDPSPLTTGDLNGQGGVDTAPGWTTPWKKYRDDAFPGGSATVQTTALTEGDQGVTLAKGTAVQTGYGRAFTTQTNATVLWEADINMPTLSGGTNIYFADLGREDLEYDAEDYVGTAGVVVLGNSWIKQYYGTSTPASTKFTNLTANTWYRLSVLLDLQADTYQIGIDGDYDVARPFHQSVDSLNGFAILCARNSFHMDNVVIMTSIPEPSTFVLLCFAAVSLLIGQWCRR